VPTRRNVLIDGGVASQPVLDLQTAEELGIESTGNSTRPPAHRAIVIPGPLHSDELVKSIDRGLIVFSSMGAWTGNTYNGVVSGKISVGLLIEHGAIVGPVKDCTFAVNVLEAFRNSLIGISSDARDMGGAMGQPGPPSRTWH
jgi:PmbA protein